MHRPFRWCSTRTVSTQPSSMRAACSARGTRVLWNRTLVDAGPVTGEVEMAAVNGGVEIYTVIEDELLRWEMPMMDSSEAL